jgi:hypothetical protein
MRLTQLVIPVILCFVTLKLMDQTRQPSEFVTLWERGVSSSKIVDLQVRFKSDNAKDSVSLGKLMSCLSSINSEMKFDSDHMNPRNEMEIVLNLKNTFSLNSLKSIAAERLFFR